MPVAALVLFLSPTVSHAQYIAVNDEGKQSDALDYLLENAIREAEESNFRFFDFGTYNESDGSLNRGLYNFKRFFGGGVVYECYRLDLTRVGL